MSGGMKRYFFVCIPASLDIISQFLIHIRIISEIKKIRKIILIFIQISQDLCL